MHTLQSKGTLAIGSHTLLSQNVAKELFEGTVLQIVCANIRRHGGAIVRVGLDDIALQVEPLGLDFGEARKEIVLGDDIPNDLQQAILKSDLSASQLSQTHHLTVRAINDLRARLEHVPVRLDGKRRLSAEAREIIRESPEPAAALMARYGISRQAISAIRKKR